MRTSYSFTPFQRRSSHSSLFSFSAAVEVGVADLLTLLANWGPCADCKLPGDCPPDLNDHCSVGVADLLALDGAQHRRKDQCYERTM